MGNELLVQKTGGKLRDPMTFFMKYYHKISFVKLLRDHKLFKTVLGTIENEGPVVVKTHLTKIASKAGGIADVLIKYRNALEGIKETFDLLKHPNVMPYQGLVLDNRAALLIRQYFPYNLRQRINSMPLLTNMDKLWLSFQLLSAVKQVHGENLHHGDIKTDNVLLTSWNWLFLTDFAPYKPFYLPSENLGDYHFFFAPESTKTAGCYLPPEKFVNEPFDPSKVPLEAKQAMDIFSAGCVLAEIFLDGQTLFDLPRLQEYRQGGYSPTELLKDIELEEIRELIADMIQIDPTKRKSAKEYLQIMAEKIVPLSFTQFTYYFVGAMLHPAFASPDRKVAAIFTHIDAIWKCCFQKDPPLIVQSMNSTIFECIRDVPLEDIIPNIIPKGFPYCFKYNGFNKEPVSESFLIPVDEAMRYLFSIPARREKNVQSAIIIAEVLGAALTACRYPSSKVCALSILKHIGIEVKSANVILNYLLPYFIDSMEDESSLVQVEAAEGGMELLSAIKMPIVLTPTDFKVFQLYIFPAYVKMGNNVSPYIRATFMKLLGKICENGKRFIEQGIINQTNYFNSLAAIERAENELKSRRKTSIEFFPGSERTISNLDTEIDEMGNMLLSIIRDITFKVPHVYQSAFVQHLHELAVLLGPKEFENITPLVFSMLNSKAPQLLQAVFEVVPRISLGIGVEWNKNLLACYDIYMQHAEELVMYSLVDCFVVFARKRLLPKKDMINLYKSFSSLLLHPNEWLRTAALNYCKAVGECLTDAEVFSHIRPLLQRFVKNFVLVTHADPFEEFLMPPLSRVILDLVEAGIVEELDYTPNDELAKLVLEKELKLKDIKILDISELKREDYDSYTKTISNVCTTLRPDCVGRGPALGSLLTLQIENGAQGFEVQKNMVFLRDDFEIFEQEADDYIDHHFCTHKPPVPALFHIDNNGMNPPQYYENFPSEHKYLTKWKKSYKAAALCKALKFYAQECSFDQLKDKQGKFFSYTITHQWRQWRPQGRLMATLNTHKAPVYSIAVSDDKTFMATGSADGVCCVWNALKLKDSLVMPVIGKIEVEGKITALSFLENTHSIAIGTDKGLVSVYRLDSQSLVSPIQKAKDVIAIGEGGVVDCCTYLTNSGQNVMVYVTQQGGIHVHDMRVKKDVNTFSMGCQRGLISSFCMGRDENNFFIGTVGGYIAGYDLRFNLITSLRRYSRGTPITNMCIYLPEKISRPTSLLAPREASTPMLFVASGGDTSQVDLCSLDKDATEWSFVVGNPKLIYRAYTPYALHKEELNYTDINQVILKKLSKGFPVTKEELKGEQNEQNYTNCHFAFKDFYGKMKTMYNANSRIYKILCPRITRNEESAPFLLTAGADKVVRYWYLGNLAAADAMKTNASEMVKQSFLVTSPDDREVEYMVEDFKEKVLYEHLVRGRATGSMGQSSWQHQNGTSYLRQHVSKIPCAGHTDAILNMGLLELPFGNFLATCGRDNLVKIWT